MRVLINVPDLKRPGGVAALFNILKMEQNYLNVSLFVLHSKIPTFLRIPYKYIDFAFKLPSADVVHINPSLDRKSFMRDAMFAWITLFFSKKLVVFWHGWDERYEAKINQSKFLRSIAKNTFLNAHSTVVLGSVFDRKLRAMGYKNQIYKETNTAENKFIEDQFPKIIAPGQVINLLFMSRLEIEKGIYIAIDTLNILNKTTKRFKLIVAGSGIEGDKIKELSATNKEIEFAGYAFGKSKHDLLSSAHFMLLPSYTEGLPLSILEGMMYGLPIISRPVGGIPDMVVDEENGYLIESFSPEDNAQKIMQLVENPLLYSLISNNNINKSKTFAPDKVRERLFSIYKSVINQ